MYYITNLDTTDKHIIRNHTVSRIGQHGDAISPFYQMEFPFQLEFYTLHPENREQYFTMASLAPSRIIYATASFTEMYPYFAASRLHHHNYYELMFVLEAYMYQVIENRRHLYTPGSCCLVNKNILHSEEHSTDYRVAFLDISDTIIQNIYNALSMSFFDIEKNRTPSQLETFLSENLDAACAAAKNYIDFIPIQDNSWVVQNIHHIFEQISQELIAPQIGSSHIIKGLIAKLIFFLDDPANYCTTPVQIGTDTENALYQQISTIMEETDGRASRSMLEEKLHYSGDYLNKITHKYTGLGIFDYGMTVCMKKAASLLSHTDRNIQEIAASLGFTNRTHFYKHFQKIYHMTPGAYRKASRQ